MINNGLMKIMDNDWDDFFTPFKSLLSPYYSNYQKTLNDEKLFVKNSDKYLYSFDFVPKTDKFDYTVSDDTINMLISRKTENSSSASMYSVTIPSDCDKDSLFTNFDKEKGKMTIGFNVIKEEKEEETNKYEEKYNALLDEYKSLLKEHLTLKKKLNSKKN